MFMQHLVHSYPLRKVATRQSHVLVLPNGQYEMRARIAHVVNIVYAQHKQDPTRNAILGGKVVDAYYKCAFLGSKISHAQH